MERRLAAILAADVVSYSSMMEKDEAGTLQAVSNSINDIINPLVEKHKGRVVKLMGDGILVEFSSAVDAVECALEWQKEIAETTDKLQFRIGINLGDIISQDADIFGNGVNIAARLEALAEPGGIFMSDIVYQSVHKIVDANFENMGEQRVKNFTEPVRTYRIKFDQSAMTQKTSTSSPSSGDDRPSIAVLAFDNMSGDPEQEYFSDGISEDIITELSRFQELFVIARNSSFSYKGKSTKIQQIAKDLGVTYVVEGSVRKSGKRLRITVQLIEARTGKHIWAERYDRELEDMFELQDEITQTIVRVLPIRLQGALIKHARRKPSESLSAYECFLRAQKLYDHTSSNARETLDELAAAIRIDPQFAQAHALTAYVHAYSVFTLSPIGDDPLAPDYQYEGLAEANYMLGNYEEAIRIYERWRDPPVHMYSHLAACYAQLGLMEKSQQTAALFEQSRPKESDFSFYAAAHARLCKQPEDAEHWLEGYRKAGLLD